MIPRKLLLTGLAVLLLTASAGAECRTVLVRTGQDRDRKTSVMIYPDEEKERREAKPGSGPSDDRRLAPAADPVTDAMRAALAKVNAVHAGTDRKAVDDAVTELHRDIARHDPKVFVPLAVPHLMRLAPHDTATRVLLRKALAEGWLDEFTARTDLVQAGDTPGPHVAVMIKAVEGTDRQARRAALRALAGVGAARADALPALREVIDRAKADPGDYRRAYTLRNEAPDHVLAQWAIDRIEADLKAKGGASKDPGPGGPADGK